MRRIIALLNSTGDPVADAERHQQHLEEAYPDREGAVRMILDVWVSAKGGNPIELMNNAHESIKETLCHGDVIDWDYEFKEVEFDEYS